MDGRCSPNYSARSIASPTRTEESSEKKDYSSGTKGVGIVRS